MSGLEVAGVVLGAIPLIISALEHYGDGIRVMKNMKNYAIIFDDFITQLDASIGIYMNTCYELLGPLNLPDNQMTALLNEGKTEAWSDADLQAALKARLGDNHHRYNNGKPPWISLDGTVDEKARKKFFKSFWLKTRGGFNTEKYGALLVDIDRDIEKLSKLINGALLLEPIRTEKRTKLQSAYWKVLETKLLTHGFRHRGPDEDSTRFAFLLTFDKRTQSTSSPPWDWRGIEIESLQLASTAVAVTASQVQAPGKKTAHFAPLITVSSSSRPPLSRSLSSGLVAKIESLCCALVAANRQDCCLGILEDEAWQHHVYSVTGPTSKAQICEAASSNEITHGTKRIAPRQKCMLALTLASSVLQLHNTPWLPRAWETKDIFFLKNRGGNAIPSQFYVSQTFTSASQVAAAVKRRRLVKNETVFALGVALLELAHGASILSLKEPEDLSEDGKEDSMTEVSIATRLARELNTYESESYARAVL
ncbi:hypothetical protein GQ44DRAFT_773661 [Phaeosphaeriaceae sp. PMI808]|nr:hypothetical protein GQ44DRAFT_773661 [Phaeosphaeriaceae sp. PMI808]